MRVATLYDVHGNLPALAAVLGEVAQIGPDAVVFGGDLFSGAFPRETLALARSIPDARFVRGNADVLDPEAPEPFHWPYLQLTDEETAFAAGWEPTVTLEIDGLGRTLFCHAVPANERDIVTQIAPDEVFAAAFGGADADVVVCGHTHMQYDRRADGVRVVNAGSVGMPYEGRPGAYWALLGPSVELRRTEYDVEAAAATIRESGWSMADKFAAENVLTVPPPDEVAPFFERQAGRG